MLIQYSGSHGLHQRCCLVDFVVWMQLPLTATQKLFSLANLFRGSISFIIFSFSPPINTIQQHHGAEASSPQNQESIIF